MGYQNKMKKILIICVIIVISLISLGTYFFLSKIDNEISITICKGIDTDNELIIPLKSPINVIENKTVYFITDIQKKEGFYTSQIITADGTAAYTKELQIKNKKLTDIVKIEYLPNTSFYYVIIDGNNRELVRKKFSIVNSNVTLNDFKTTINLLQENKCVDLYAAEDPIINGELPNEVYYIGKKTGTIYIHADLKNIKENDEFIMKVACDGLEIASNTWKAKKDANEKWLTLEIPNKLSIGKYDAIIKYKNQVIYVRSFEVVN